MKKIILSLFFILFIISCSQGDNIDVLKKTSPISINPLVNFTSFYNELEPSEQDCLLSEFSGKNEIINFVSDNSIPSQKLSDCIGQNTNFRILQGLFCI